MPKFHFALSFFLSLVFWFGSAYSAELHVSVSPNQPTVGEYVKVIANMRGQINLNHQAQISHANCPGLKINWNNIISKNSSSRNINGRTSVQVVLAWQAEVVQAGEYTFSPLQISFGNQKLISKPFKIKIKPSQTSKYYNIMTSIEHKEAYLGQAIPLHIDFLMADQEISKFERAHGRQYETAKIHYRGVKVPETFNKDFYVTPKQYNQQLSKNGVYFGTNYQNISLNGIKFRRQRLTMLLEPKRLGRLNIPAIPCDFISLNVRERIVPGLFGSRHKQMSLEPSAPIAKNSNSIVLKVIPTPKDKQPPTFYGLVATQMEFNLHVVDIQANQKVQLHSPLAVEFTVKSDLPAQSLKLPDFNKQKIFINAFDVSAHTALKESVEGGSRFKEIIFRPKDKNIKAIPPIEICYFNPVTKTYQQAKTNAFPLQVEAIAIDPNTTGGPMNNPLLKVEKQEASTVSSGRLEGIEQNINELQKHESQKYSAIVIFALSGLPWLSFLALHFFKNAKQSSEQKKQDNQFGLQNSIKQLDQAQTASQKLDILNQYIIHRWNIRDPRSIPLSDSGLANELDETLSILESSSYASSTNNDQGIQNNQLLELMTKLDKAGS